MIQFASTYSVADTERLGDEIARLAAHLHAATYRLLVLIREFDEREGWSDGFRTCGHWLSWRTGIAPGAAREKVRVARALGCQPARQALNPSVPVATKRMRRSDWQSKLRGTPVVGHV